MPRDVQLEPLGDRRPPGATSGQGRLAGRIIVEDRRPLDAQARLDPLRQQQVEPAVAIVAAKLAGDGNASAAAPRRQLRAARPSADRRPTCMLKRLGVADRLGRPASQQALAQLGEQSHPLVHPVAAAIPLDDRELGIVERAPLARRETPE